MEMCINSNFSELTEMESLSVDGGGWLSVVGGGLIIAGAIVSGGGAVAIGAGIAGGVLTAVAGW